MDKIVSFKSSLPKYIMALFIILPSYAGYGQTTTPNATRWNTSSSWSTNTVPLSSGTVIVDHPLSLDVAINCIGGNYTINNKITDPLEGLNVSLNIGNNSADPNSSKIYINAPSTFLGDLIVNSSGALYIGSNDTLKVGSAIFEKDCIIKIEVGGVLIINGDLTNKNQSNDFEVNGSLIVTGTLTASGNQSAIFGTGNVSAGAYSGGGQIMGTTGSDLASRCAGVNPCYVCNNITSNTITGDQSICSGSVISEIGGPLAVATIGTATYLWESSIDGLTWKSTLYTSSDLPSTIALTSTTYFRRKAIANGCENISNRVTVTLTQSVIKDNTIAGDQTVCIGNAITATSGTEFVESGSPTYLWESSIDSATWSSLNVTTQHLSATIKPETTSYYRRSISCNGCTSTSNSIKVTLTSINNWTGVNGSWGSGTNWSCGTVPKVVQDVVINTGTAVIDLASPYARNLTIASGASLQFGNASSLLILLYHI